MRRKIYGVKKQRIKKANHHNVGRKGNSGLKNTQKNSTTIRLSDRDLTGEETREGKNNSVVRKHRSTTHLRPYTKLETINPAVRTIKTRNVQQTTATQIMPEETPSQTSTLHKRREKQCLKNADTKHRETKMDTQTPDQQTTHEHRREIQHLKHRDIN